MRQTYPNKRLLVVNATGQSLLEEPSPLVLEQMVDGAHVSVASLRNVALELGAADDWYCLWDADDYSRPDRLSWQMACRRDGYSCLLRSQFRFNFCRGSGRVVAHAAGIPATAIWPGNHGRFRVSGSQSVEDDLSFLRRHFGARIYSVANPPLMSVAFFHGLNVLSESLFMESMSGPEFAGRIELDAALVPEFQSVLAIYGLLSVIKTH